MADRQRVLLVDSETDTAEVLKAVLEPRGLCVDRVRDLATPPSSTPPSLLIIDDDKPSVELRRSAGWAGVPRVVIGSTRLPETGEDAPRYLQKPFQYPELIRVIDQLLAGRAA